MANTREKGKIPHDEWPNILAKYNQGDSIAQIARDYGCTAPAIRYIIKRSGGLKDASRPERAGAAPHLRPQASGAAEGRELSATAAVPPLVSSRRPARGHVLGQELHQRVTGDIASFLAALDDVVLEGSLERVMDLQEATDQLMRSAARTRLELERLLSQRETSQAREKSRAKPGSAQRGA
jgi:transposase-like protein